MSKRARMIAVAAGVALVLEAGVWVAFGGRAHTSQPAAVKEAPKGVEPAPVVAKNPAPSAVVPPAQPTPPTAEQSAALSEAERSRRAIEAKKLELANHPPPPAADALYVERYAGMSKADLQGQLDVFRDLLVQSQQRLAQKSSAWDQDQQYALQLEIAWLQNRVNQP